VRRRSLCLGSHPHHSAGRGRYGFRKYIVGNTTIKRLYTGTQWSAGPAWNGVIRKPEHIQDLLDRTINWFNANLAARKSRSFQTGKGAVPKH
jgi:hypothetical protein